MEGENKAIPKQRRCEVKKLLRIWAPHFVKLMPSEARELKHILFDAKNGDYVADSEVWDEKLKG